MAAMSLMPAAVLVYLVVVIAVLAGAAFVIAYAVRKGWDRGGRDWPN